MWKYIIIGSVTLFLGASYLFSKNHGAMTTSGGEIAAVQTQLEQAIGKNKNISLDKTIKAYAEYRTEWLTAEKSANENKKAEAEAKTEEAKSELESLTREYETITQSLEALKQEKTEAFAKAAPVVDLDPDSATEEEIGDAAKTLMDGNVELERKNAEEEAKIAALGAESERLCALIAAAKKLAQDRQARISPPELKCSVLSADRQWDYVILDAGINKGIVIGSRLAVMRGDKKICELNVTLVETDRASCDVVYSTMVTGERVEVGDTIVSVRNNK
ncbi:MAG: hypothetical protein IKZ13_05935 [Akkermansia sp.]|nr:hypothetical protein [Akkermansia sp.]